jgi:hypothetical protein
MNGSRIARAAVVAMGLAVAGTMVPAQAGRGPSQECHGGSEDVSIVTNPVSLGVQTHTHQVTSGGFVLATACYSTTPNGSTAPDLAGGSVTVLSWGPGQVGYVACSPDSGASLQTGCYVPYWWFVTQKGIGATAGGNVGTVTVGETGASVGDDSPLGVHRPCVYVNGSQLAPGCGSPL